MNIKCELSMKLYLNESKIIQYEIFSFYYKDFIVYFTFLFELYEITIYLNEKPEIKTRPIWYSEMNLVQSSDRFLYLNSV